MSIGSYRFSHWFRSQVPLCRVDAADGNDFEFASQMPFIFFNFLFRFDNQFELNRELCALSPEDTVDRRRRRLKDSEMCNREANKLNLINSTQKFSDQIQRFFHDRLIHSSDDNDRLKWNLYHSTRRNTFDFKLILMFFVMLFLDQHTLVDFDRQQKLRKSSSTFVLYISLTNQ